MDKTIKHLNHVGTQVLKTERLTLRPFTTDDAKDVFAFTSNPRVTKFLSYDPHEYLDTTVKTLRKWVDDYVMLGTYKWAIELDGVVIGDITVVERQDACFRCYLGWQLNDEYWNKGYMTEAAAAVRDFLFEVVGYERICATHDVRNIGSGKVMQKIGMTLEGTWRDHSYTSDGSIADTNHWAILKKEWKTRNLKNRYAESTKSETLLIQEKHNDRPNEVVVAAVQKFADELLALYTDDNITDDMRCPIGVVKQNIIDVLNRTINPK